MENTMSSIQHIYRKGTFDAGHRVMNERMKCFNIHGHTYHYELLFRFNSMQSIGYAIDFKEIKRLASSWIDDMLDHAFISNPLDVEMLRASADTSSKVWVMSLAGESYCNPTVENIAKEIFLACSSLFEGYPNLMLESVVLDETPNCGTVCTERSIVPEEWRNFQIKRAEELRLYAKEKGSIEYDDRKINNGN